MVTYTVQVPDGATREGTLAEALEYATGAWEGTGWVTSIVDDSGDPVWFEFTPAGQAVVKRPRRCECGRVCRWRAGRWWAFCEECCAQRGI